MAKGLDNFGEFGEPMDISFGVEAADRVRSIAALEGLSPADIARIGLMYLDNHLELERQGWEGPFYEREVQPETGGILERFFTKDTKETIKCKYVDDPLPPEEA